MDKKHKIVMVDLAHPCTACLITDNLMREVLGKVKKQRDDTEICYVVLDNPKDISKVENVEVEKYPLIIIDGEQVSAGNFMTPAQILACLDMGE